MSPKPRPIAERFWEKVAKGEGCWEWQAYVTTVGYGSFTISKAEGWRGAHRVSWELTYGPIPAGLFVCHHCDNRACVRPDHLFLGTQSDNLRDMVRKGRDNGFKRWGELSPLAKLSEAQARSIFVDYEAGLTQTQIAERLGVSQSMVSLILRRERWPGLSKDVAA